MSKILYSVIALILLSTSQNIYAQDIAGCYPYRSYEFRAYIDDLDHRIIPSVFNESYYFKIKKRDFKENVMIIDTTLRKTTIHLRSPKARDGFCDVNKSIMNAINDLLINISDLKLVYIYNGTIVSEKKHVVQVLRMKKHIAVHIGFMYDDKSRTLTVFIRN